jgi:hypothetical protein
VPAVGETDRCERNGKSLSAQVSKVQTCAVRNLLIQRVPRLPQGCFPSCRSVFLFRWSVVESLKSSIESQARTPQNKHFHGIAGNEPGNRTKRHACLQVSNSEASKGCGDQRCQRLTRTNNNPVTKIAQPGQSGHTVCGLATSMPTSFGMRYDAVVMHTTRNVNQKPEYAWLRAMRLLAAMAMPLVSRNSVGSFTFLNKAGKIDRAR